MSRTFAREWLWFVGCQRRSSRSVHGVQATRKNLLGQLVRMREPDKFFGDFDAQIAARVIAEVDANVAARTKLADGSCDVRVPGLGILKFDSHTSADEIAASIRDQLRRVEHWERVPGVPLDAYDRSKFNLWPAAASALGAGLVLYLALGLIRLTLIAVRTLKRTA